MALKVGELYATIGLDTGGFKKALDGAKNALSSVKTAIGGVLKVGGLLSAAWGAIGTVGVKYNADIEQLQTSFEVMTGSAEEGAEVLAKIRKLGAETPFETAGLAETVQLLMNYNLTADESIDVMKMLGDVAQGDQGKLTRIATAYGQMSSAGKVSLEDIKQMIEAGFNPLAEISASTGESMASLYDRISKGKISVDEITQSMKRSTSAGGKYFKSMEKQSKTLNGRLSTLQDTAMTLLGNLVGGVSDTLRDKILPDAIDFLDDLNVAFEKDGFEGLWQAVAKKLPEIGKKMMDGLRALGDGLKSGAGRVMIGIGEKIEKSQSFSGFGKKLIEAGLALKSGEKIDFGGLLVALKDGIVAWIRDEAIPYVQGLDWGGLWQGFWDRLTDFAMWLPDAYFDVGYIIGQISKSLVGIAQKCWDALIGALDSDGDKSTFSASEFWSALLGGANWFTDLAANFIAGVYNGFTGATISGEDVKRAFSQFFDQIKNAFKELGEELWDYILSGMGFFPEKDADLEKRLKKTLGIYWDDDGDDTHGAYARDGKAQEGSGFGRTTIKVEPEMGDTTAFDAELKSFSDGAGTSFAAEFGSSGKAPAAAAGTEIASEVKASATKALQAGATLGANFAGSLAKGIRDSIAKIRSAALAAALAAKKAVQSALQIHSPSKVSMKLGGYFSQGMADGILKNARSVSLASGRMAEMAASGLRYTPVRRAASSVPSDVALTIDYDRLAGAMAQRQTVLVSNGRVLARSTAADNSQALGAYKRRVAMGYGG